MSFLKNNYIDIHTHHPQISGEISIRNVDLASPISDLTPPFSSPVSIGLHPWTVEQKLGVTALRFVVEEFCFKKNVFAIGEIGLDRLRGPKLVWQKELLVSLLDLSEAAQKPVLLHNVKCSSEFLEILKGRNYTAPWIFHGYQSSPETTAEFLRYENIFFSFGKALLEREKVQTVFKNIPTSRIFFETDDEKNEDLLSELYKLGADLKNISVGKLESDIYRNYEAIFL